MAPKTLPFMTFLCALFVVLLSACQNQESGLPGSLTKDDPAVTGRSECEPCDNECCCGITLDDDSAAIIQICGTTSGGPACVTVSGNCGSPIDGTLESVLLNSTNPKHVFCMAANTAIRIVNLSLSDNAKVLIGCNTLDYDALEFDIAPQDSIKLEVGTLMNCEMTGDCS